MRYEELRTMLTEHFRMRLASKRAEIDANGRLGPSTRDEIQRNVESILSAKKDGKPLLLGKIDDTELLKRFVSKFQLDIKPGSEQYGWLRTEIANSYVSYLRAIVAYDDSLDNYDFRTDQIPSRNTNALRTTHTAVSISRLGVDYRAEKQVGDNWAERTKLEKVDHLRLLEEILGADTDIRNLTPAHIKTVKDILMSYPKNRFKKAETKDRPLAELVSMSEITRIQVPTMNKYLQTYNDMFEWARRNSLVDNNYFSGSIIKQKRGARQEKRDMFSDSQIQIIIKSIELNDIGIIKKHYQKWGPLIGLYTGARLNEIAQLELSDIRQLEGVWIFDLNDEGDEKQLKSAAARRLVPVHNRLIELGLLETAELLKAKGSRHVFPDLTDSVEHGRGRNLGRWFNERFLPQLGIKKPELVFHSLRHTVITKLLQADVPEPIVKALVGHARVGVTQQNYFKGYAIEQLNASLQLLEYRPKHSSASQAGASLHQQS